MKNKKNEQGDSNMVVENAEPSGQEIVHSEQSATPTNSITPI